MDVFSSVCYSLGVRLVHYLLFFKKTYPSHDHEFWTFVVDGSTVVVV